MEESVKSRLSDFLYSSVTPHHVVANLADELLTHGFERVELGKQLPTNPGPYFTVVSETLFAWILPEKLSGFRLVGSHSDSPGFKVRPNPDRKSSLGHQLAVEVYGAPLWNSWLDRPLSFAGAVLVDDKSGPVKKLFRMQKPVAAIPQLAVHLDRGVNSNGLKLDERKDLNPVLFAETESFAALVADEVGVSPEKIISWDVMPYDFQPPAIVGTAASEVIMSARIDNLVSVFASVEALCGLESASGIAPVMCVYNHEEVGSTSSEGASSATTLRLLNHIAKARDVDISELLAATSLLSVDCAHATHPSHRDKHEQGHDIVMNGGVCLKRNDNQAYSTSLDSELEVLGTLMTQFQLQKYSHPNHLRCGTTIGPLLSTQLGVPSVDIGVPQYAMHSVRETAGLTDIAQLTQLISAYLG